MDGSDGITCPTLFLVLHPSRGRQPVLTPETTPSHTVVVCRLLILLLDVWSGFGLSFWWSIEAVLWLFGIIDLCDGPVSVVDGLCLDEISIPIDWSSPMNEAGFLNTSIQSLEWLSWWGFCGRWMRSLRCWSIDALRKPVLRRWRCMSWSGGFVDLLTVPGRSGGFPFRIGGDLHVGEDGDLVFNHVSFLSRVLTRIKVVTVFPFTSVLNGSLLGLLGLPLGLYVGLGCLSVWVCMVPNLYQ